MIFHCSIAADDPGRVARVLAELWGGEARRFPSVGRNSAIALARDGRGTAVEVYERGTELVPADGDADSEARISPAMPRTTATHLALGSNLSWDEVLAIGAREGWITKYRKRGGVFGVIELWLENATLVEVLTPDMQVEYLAAMGASAPPWPAVAPAQ